MSEKVTDGMLRFINQSVGHNKANNRSDAKTIQQLLIAAGFPIGKDKQGKWGSDSQAAFCNYLNAKSKGPYGNLIPKFKLHIDRDDPILLLLAYDAGILFPLPDKAGFKGLIEMHSWLENNNIGYQAGAEKGEGNRATWGVFGSPNFAAQTVGKYRKIIKGPPLLDCTTYANLMLSIYYDGDCHKNYKAALSATGGGSATTEHIGKERYGMELVESDNKSTTGEPLNYLKGLEEIRSKTSTNPTKLHHIEVAGTKWVEGKKIYGFITHMALLYGGVVYECRPKGGCVKRTLESFMSDKESRVIYLFREA